MSFKKEKIKLKDIAEINMGQSPPSSSYNDEYGTPFLQGNADFGKVYPKIKKYTSNPLRLADINDVLLSVRAPIGAVNIANIELCIGRGLSAIKAKENKTFSKYIYYYLLSQKTYFNSQGTGSTFKAINKKTIELSELYNYPLPVQQQIVSELDILNAIIDKKREQLTELDNLAQATFYDMFGDPIDNEKGWEVKELGEVCSSIVRGPFGSALKKEFFVEKSDSTYKVYQQMNAIQNNASLGTYYIDKERYQGLTRFTVKPNDIIMSCSGTIGRLLIIPENAEKGIINQALLKFTLNESIKIKYFEFLMSSLINNVESKGSGIKNIASVKYIRSLELGLPPLSLQEQFANKIELIEHQKELIERSIADVQQLFDYTMDRYFG